MGRKYRIASTDQYYFVTFTTIGWIDLFTRTEYCNIFLDSIRYCQKNKGLLVGAWCIMSSHIHLILGVEKNGNLSNVIRDLKSYTSRHIRKFIEASPYESRKSWLLDLMYQAGVNKVNNKDFQLWQQHNHPIELSSSQLTLQRMDYLHNNPVEAGWVDKPRDWLYSSARDYEDEKGMIDITFLY